MSDFEEYLTVIQKLLERTREGKVAWEEQVESFRIVTEGSSSTSLLGVVQPYRFRISKVDDQGDIKITLQMLDDKNAEIFGLQVADDPETLRKNRQLISDLKMLFELARRKALNVDAKIHEVSAILDGL